MTQDRFSGLKAWFKTVLPEVGSSGEWEVVSGDASFRKYYRYQHQSASFIGVDAPPEQENLEAFLSVQQLLSRHNIPVPLVHGVSLGQGYMALSDLGDTLLLSQLTELQKQLDDQACLQANPYKAALDLLLQCQQIPEVSCSHLPRYDHALLLRELRLFDEWCLTKLLNRTLPAAQLNALYAQYETLISDVSAQPKTFVHRDYHARNIMVLTKMVSSNEPITGLTKEQLGLIDFQDAVWGPVTYDLVSLLRDAYIQWPAEQVERWVAEYQQQLQNAKVMEPVTEEAFLKWFDLMGLQRQLKVLGIFARLSIRDGKNGYLKDMPLVLTYAKAAAERYEEYVFIADLLGEIEPKILAAVEA